MTHTIHTNHPSQNRAILTHLGTTLTRIHLWHTGTPAAETDPITDTYLNHLHPDNPRISQEDLTTAINRGLKTGTRHQRHTYHRTLLTFLHHTDTILDFTTNPKTKITYPNPTPNPDYIALMLGHDHIWQTFNRGKHASLTQTITRAHAPHIHHLKNQTYDNGARKLNFLNELIQQQLVIEGNPTDITRVHTDIANLEPTWINLYKQVLTPTMVSPIMSS